MNQQEFELLVKDWLKAEAQLKELQRELQELQKERPTIKKAYKDVAAYRADDASRWAWKKRCDALGKEIDGKTNQTNEVFRSIMEHIPSGIWFRVDDLAIRIPPFGGSGIIWHLEVKPWKEVLE